MQINRCLAVRRYSALLLQEPVMIFRLRAPDQVTKAKPSRFRLTAPFAVGAITGALSGGSVALGIDLSQPVVLSNLGWAFFIALGGTAGVGLRVADGRG